jgi:hypothetical protein
MHEIQNIKELMNSSIYQEVMSKLAFLNNIKIINATDLMMSFDLKKLECSGLSCDELLSTLICFRHQVELFVIEKNRTLMPEDDDQEFPKDVQFEFSKTIEIIGTSSGFLLIALIEFRLIMTSSNALLYYLKKVRIPHAKKYAKQLCQCYANAKSA